MICDQRFQRGLKRNGKFWFLMTSVQPQEKRAFSPIPLRSNPELRIDRTFYSFWDNSPTSNAVNAALSEAIKVNSTLQSVKCVSYATSTLELTVSLPLRLDLLVLTAFAPLLHLQSSQHQTWRGGQVAARASRSRRAQAAALNSSCTGSAPPSASS